MALFNFGRSQAKPAGFKRVLTNTDFGMGGSDITITGSQYNKVGEFTVPAQQIISVGSNDPTGGGSIAGTAGYVRFDRPTGTQTHGLLRVAVTNANETNTVIVVEEQSRRWSADQTDRTKAVLLPESMVKAREDSRIQLLWKPATAGENIVNGSSTLVLLPVTVYQ